MVTYVVKTQESEGSEAMVEVAGVVVAELRYSLSQHSQAVISEANVRHDEGGSLAQDDYVEIYQVEEDESETKIFAGRVRSVDYQGVEREGIRYVVPGLELLLDEYAVRINGRYAYTWNPNNEPDPCSPDSLLVGEDRPWTIGYIIYDIIEHTLGWESRELAQSLAWPHHRNEIRDINDSGYVPSWLLADCCELPSDLLERKINEFNVSGTSIRVALDELCQKSGRFVWHIDPATRKLEVQDLLEHSIATLNAGELGHWVDEDGADYRLVSSSLSFDLSRSRAIVAVQGMDRVREARPTALPSPYPSSEGDWDGRLMPAWGTNTDMAGRLWIPREHSMRPLIIGPLAGYAGEDGPQLWAYKPGGVTANVDRGSSRYRIIGPRPSLDQQKEMVDPVLAPDWRRQRSRSREAARSDYDALSSMEVKYHVASGLVETSHDLRSYTSETSGVEDANGDTFSQPCIRLWCCVGQKFVVVQGPTGDAYTSYWEGDPDYMSGDDAIPPMHVQVDERYRPWSRSMVGYPFDGAYQAGYYVYYHRYYTQYPGGAPDLPWRDDTEVMEDVADAWLDQNGDEKLTVNVTRDGVTLSPTPSGWLTYVFNFANLGDWSSIKAHVMDVAVDVHNDKLVFALSNDPRQVRVVRPLRRIETTMEWLKGTKPKERKSNEMKYEEDLDRCTVHKVSSDNQPLMEVNPIVGSTFTATAGALFTHPCCFRVRNAGSGRLKVTVTSKSGDFALGRIGTLTPDEERCLSFTVTPSEGDNSTTLTFTDETNSVSTTRLLTVNAE